MAKVRINKLPKGFHVVDGKVKKKALKRDGGMITGDQADYGLITTPQEYYGQTNFNNDLDDSVRYSLSSVPRDEANIEAEGGETVLTDLSGDGQFGLYSITGPRHSSGGVPMYLPEQSFIYSDTAGLKMDRNELAEFGIESRKKITPAQVSKRYQLNPFYGVINDQYADNISTASAELMLKKNMSNLSKLAFGQEVKKNFEDGVPLASYPYLVEKGIDPIEFAATVEQSTRQKQELELLASLPPEQQQKMLQMQAMMENIDGQPQQQQSVDPQMPDPNNQIQPIPEGMDQGPVAEFQKGGEKASEYAKRKGQDWPEGVKDPTFDGKVWVFDDGTPSLSKSAAMNLAMNVKATGNIPEPYRSETIEVEEVGSGQAKEVKPEVKTEVEDGSIDDSGTSLNTSTAKPIDKNPLPKTHPQWQEFEDAINNGYRIVATRDETQGVTNYEAIEVLPPNKFENFVQNEQRQLETKGTGNISVISDEDAALNAVYEGADDNNVRIRKGIYANQDRPEKQGWMGENSNSFGGDFTTPEAEADFMLRYGDDIKTMMPSFDFQMKSGKWVNGKPADEQARKYKAHWTEAQTLMQEIENKNHYEIFGKDAKSKPRVLFPCSGDRPGTCIDGKLGFDTFNKGRTYVRVEKPDILNASVEDERKPSESGDIVLEKQDMPDWWWQDLNNIATQNSLENPLFMPNVTKLPQERVNYVLDDWTAKVNAINANTGQYMKNLRGYGKGKVAGTNAFGKGAEEAVKAIASTNTNNVGIMNNAARTQADLNLRTGVFNAKQQDAEYDGSVRALQRFIDFENWDKKESNKLYNDAITNRANTYNLNMLKDYMEIDPSIGGMQVQKGEKPLAVNKDDREPWQIRQDSLIEIDKKTSELYPNATVDERMKLNQYFLDGTPLTGKKTEKRNPSIEDENNDFNIPSVTVPNTTVGKKGGSMKRFANPFYTGKMGI